MENFINFKPLQPFQKFFKSLWGVKNGKLYQFLTF